MSQSSRQCDKTCPPMWSTTSNGLARKCNCTKKTRPHNMYQLHTPSTTMWGTRAQRSWVCRRLKPVSNTSRLLNDFLLCRLFTILIWKPQHLIHLSLVCSIQLGQALVGSFASSWLMRSANSVPAAPKAGSRGGGRHNLLPACELTSCNPLRRRCLGGCVSVSVWATALVLLPRC